MLPTADAPLVYTNPWAKGRPIGAVFMLGMGIGIHFVEQQHGGPAQDDPATAERPWSLLEARPRPRD